MSMHGGAGPPQHGNTHSSSAAHDCVSQATPPLSLPPLSLPLLEPSALRLPPVPSASVVKAVVGMDDVEPAVLSPDSLAVVLVVASVLAAVVESSPPQASASAIVTIGIDRSHAMATRLSR